MSSTFIELCIPHLLGWLRENQGSHGEFTQVAGICAKCGVMTGVILLQVEKKPEVELGANR